jgi:hypothetical protein
MPTAESLLQQVRRFKKLVRVPKNPPTRYLSMFLLAILRAGNDISMWSEDAWQEAIVELGYPESQMMGYMETVASWGEVDNGLWLTDAQVQEIRDFEQF